MKCISIVFLKIPERISTIAMLHGSGSTYYTPQHGWFINSVEMLRPQVREVHVRRIEFQIGNLTVARLGDEKARNRVVVVKWKERKKDRPYDVI